MRNKKALSTTTPAHSATTKTIGGKEYIVKSVYSDEGADIESMILSLAERKTIKEMGLDMPTEKSRIA